MSDTATPEKVGSVTKVYKYFGVQQGRRIADFQQEWMKLSDEDKMQLTEGILNDSLTY